MKTHWKKLVNVDYLGAYSLEDGKDLNITLGSVRKEIVKGSGGKEEECTVAQVKNNKPFIINRTNAKMITKILNSPYIEDWNGKTITLYAATTKVAGEVVECLRVRPVVPKELDLKPFIVQIDNCKTLEELGSLWNSVGFPQLKLSDHKNKKKDELSKNTTADSGVVGA